MKNKYNIGEKIKTKIHYQNDKRKNVEAVILAIVLENDENVKYKIEFDPDERHRVQGCTGCIGYVSQDDIIHCIVE